MPADMRAIEEMLGGYSQRLSGDLQERLDAFDALPDATTEEGTKFKVAIIEAMMADGERYEQVSAAHRQLAEQREAAERVLFAGPLIPTNPIAAAQLRNGLLEDRDDADLAEYLRLEDWEDRADPLFVAFDEIDTEMLTWRAETPELATAIAIAVEWDEREGMGWQWPDRVVRRARKLGLAKLPRPH